MPCPIFAIIKVAPNDAQAKIDPQYDSYKSAPMPATSPTLSPTLSAIVAGFLGSSSGIPASTLPTKSAPTSAAFVKIPPPTREKEPLLKPPYHRVIMKLLIQQT